MGKEEHTKRNRRTKDERWERRERDRKGTGTGRVK